MPKQWRMRMGNKLFPLPTKVPDIMEEGVPKTDSGAVPVEGVVSRLVVGAATATLTPETEIEQVTKLSLRNDKCKKFLRVFLDGRYKWDRNVSARNSHGSGVLFSAL